MLIGMDILGPEGAVVDLPAQRLRLGENISCPLTIKSLGRLLDVKRSRRAGR